MCSGGSRYDQRGSCFCETSKGGERTRRTLLLALSRTVLRPEYAEEILVKTAGTGKGFRASEGLQCPCMDVGKAGV